MRTAFLDFDTLGPDDIDICCGFQGGQREAAGAKSKIAFIYALSGTERGVYYLKGKVDASSMYDF
jgi:hypothetical protein